MSKVSSTAIVNQHYVRNYTEVKYHRNLTKLELEKQKLIQEETKLMLHHRMQIEIEKIKEYEKLHQRKLYSVSQRGCNIDAYI